MKMNWKPKKLIKVSVAGDFSLYCTFGDKTIMTFDMSSIVERKGPMIEPLKKKAFFNKVFLEMGVPTWPNGFDVCPDLIFMKGIQVRKTLRKKAA